MHCFLLKIANNFTVSGILISKITSSSSFQMRKLASLKRCSILELILIVLEYFLAVEYLCFTYYTSIAILSKITFSSSFQMRKLACGLGAALS